MPSKSAAPTTGLIQTSIKCVLVGVLQPQLRLTTHAHAARPQCARPHATTQQHLQSRRTTATPHALTARPQHHHHYSRRLVPVRRRRRRGQDVAPLELRAQPLPRRIRAHGVRQLHVPRVRRRQDRGPQLVGHGRPGRVRQVAAVVVPLDRRVSRRVQPHQQDVALCPS